MVDGEAAGSGAAVFQLLEVRIVHVLAWSEKGEMKICNRQRRDRYRVQFDLRAGHMHSNTNELKANTKANTTHTEEGGKTLLSLSRKD